MKNKKMLLIFTAIIFSLSCSNENGDKNNNIKNIKNLKTEQEYLKSIDYSNITDKVTQNKIHEILEFTIPKFLKFQNL